MRQIKNGKVYTSTFDPFAPCEKIAKDIRENKDLSDMLVYTEEILDDKLYEDQEYNVGKQREASERGLAAFCGIKI